MSAHRFICVLTISAGFALPALPLHAQGANVPATDYSQSPDEGPAVKDDRQAMGALAQRSIAGIDAGRLALEKSQDAALRKFAQQMIDDNAQALGEVEALAQKKAVLLPDGPGAVAKAKLAALKALSGRLFEREYARHAGIGEHERTAKLLLRIEAEGKDADLRLLATRLRPVAERHLVLARELERELSATR